MPLYMAWSTVEKRSYLHCFVSINPVASEACAYSSILLSSDGVLAESLVVVIVSS
jgi:hypothetical protein